LKSAGDPLAETLLTENMWRTPAVLFALLALIVEPGAQVCAAQTIVPPPDVANSISTKQPNPHSNSAAGAPSGEDSVAESELLAAANKSRAMAGVPSLRVDDTMRQAAAQHAWLMIEHGQLEHHFAGESPLLQRIAAVSPLRMDHAGENIAYANCARNVDAALMNSPPHRENLLDRGFNVAGIAAIWSHGRLYVVQDFARELPSYSARQSGRLVSEAIEKLRLQARLAVLDQQAAPTLDAAACSLARDDHPNAHLLAAAYDNRKIITYAASYPEQLPSSATRMLREAGVHQFAVGTCYARNTAYPTGTFWIAILLY
jgi:uncharacterized protein YkwD